VLANNLGVPRLLQTAHPLGAAGIIVGSRQPAAQAQSEARRAGSHAQSSNEHRQSSRIKDSGERQLDAAAPRSIRR
jgi:hypothetical protein